MKKLLNLNIIASFLLLVAMPGCKTFVPLYNPEVLSKAQNGDAEAQFQMGKAYFESFWDQPLLTQNGTGVKNWEEAEQWFIKAAEQGHVKAQYYLYQQFDRKSDTVSNTALLEKAAYAGISDAQYSFGGTYLTEGFNTPKDLSLAYMWISLARKDKLNQYGNVGVLSLRDLIEVYKISHLEISKGQKMAKEHLEKYGPSTSMYPDSE